MRSTIWITSIAAAGLVAGCGLGGTANKTTASTAKKSTPSTAFVTIQSPATVATTPAPTVPQTQLSQVPGQVVKGTKPGPNDRYIVKSGDAIGLIAQAMGVKTQDLLDANGLTTADATRIQPGQPLRIPDGGVMPPGGELKEGKPAGSSNDPSSVIPVTAVSGARYTVQSGDTWIGIATRLKVDLTAMLTLNGGTIEAAPNIIPGQKLKVPGKTQAEVDAASKVAVTTPKTTVKAATTTAKTTIKPAVTTKAPVPSS